jgi:metallo-beta-lactamase family protein
MKLTFLGAAGEVTGSCYLLETHAARVMIDCGLFQGGHDEDAKNIIPKRLDVTRLDAVVMTHGHLDHTGRLPLLGRRHYKGPIFATPATREMTQLILLDAAKVQSQDVDRNNRKRQRRGEPPLEPLYSADDVHRTISLFKPIEYDQRLEVAQGITARIVDAGHMLGSGSIEFTVEENGTKKIVAFSGDLGPRGAAILRDPEPITAADLLVLESTYGDRDHKPLGPTLIEFHNIIKQASANHGVVLVPVFAVGRAQQMLYHLAAIFRTKEMASFPVFLDSPMAIEALDIYRHHTHLFDEEALGLVKSGSLRRELEIVTVTRTADESRRINELEGPFMVLAGSGMCNAGRILHHLKHRLWQPETIVVFVGFQAHGTLGRQLVDGAKHVNILGDSIAVRAQIRTLNSFSAHAGQSELLQWADRILTTKPRLALTHGESPARTVLQAKIRDRSGISAALPVLEETLEL